MKKKGVKIKNLICKPSRKTWVAIIVAVFILSVLALNLIHVENTDITGYAMSDATVESTAATVIYFIMGDPMGSAEKQDRFETFLDAPLGKTGIVIIHIMVWLILFVAFSDIFGTFLPFGKKYPIIPWAIGFGMAVIVANFGFISTLVAWMAAITGGFGAFSVFASMIIAFITFFLITFFHNKLKVFQAKKEASAAKAGAIQAAEGVKVAKKMAKTAAAQK